MFLVTFLADVSAATSEEELLAIAERARAVDGIGEVVTRPGTTYPLRISFVRRLDAEELAARFGWALDRLTIDGFDHHRSMPELAMAAEAGAKPARPRAGQWTLEVAVAENSGVPGPHRLVGKPLAGSGVAIRWITVRR